MHQRSDEWFAARLGKVTASRISDLTAQTRSGWGASRANYMAQLIAERLTGTVQDSYSNAAMQWGIDNEAAAIAMYEFMHGVSVEPVGFVDHPTIQMSGASPDGLIGSDGLIEVKCPNTATHIETLLSEKVPGKYIKQMQWQMACTDRKWCDFVSYDPRMPPKMQMWVKRVKREHDDLEKLVADFIGEIDEKIAALKAKENG